MKQSDGTRAIGPLRDAMTRRITREFRSLELAEDVVQEALLRFLEQDENSVATPEAWLTRVCRNLAIDHLRRENRLYGSPDRLREAKDDSAEAEDHSRDSDPERALDRLDDLRRCVRLLLDVTDSEQTAIILLRQVFDTDYASLARISARTPAACRQIVHRGLIRAGQGHRTAVGGSTIDVSRQARESDVDEALDGRDRLDDYVYSIVTAEPQILFDAVRPSRPSTPDIPMQPECSSSQVAHMARSYLGVEVDAAGVHLVLYLGTIRLCTVPSRPIRPAIAR